MNKVGAVMAAVASSLALVAMVFPDVTVEVKGMHLCCQGCSGAATAAIESGGAKATADRTAGTLTITANNDKTAQKALDKLADAGFHGQIESKTLVFKEDSGANINAKLPKNAKPIMVSSLTLKGAHNCCDACNKALKASIAKVEGYESDDAANGKPTFVVKGKFSPAVLVKALNEGGFHAKVDKADIIR